MRIVLGACAAAIAALFATAAAAQTFTLDAAAAANQQDVALTVQAPATLPFKIIRSGTAPSGNVTVSVTPFTNEQGLAKRVTIAAPGAPGDDLDHLSVPFADTVLPVTLKIPELPPGGKYTGRLILSAGQAAPSVWRFVLTTANELRPAALVVDKSAETIAVVRPWCLLGTGLCLPGDAPTATVHLRDKTGNWQLEGVTARLEPGLKSPGAGFDFKKHMAAAFNGTEVPDIFASAAQGQRIVPPRGQATIILSFKDLSAGEYVIPLRFGATNSADDDLQRFTVTLQVRNHLFTAILILVLAAVLSFLATRVVTMLRQRAGFLARVQAMRPAWLGREPATLSVIWLRATLRQAEDLSRRYWLTGQNEIDARLTGAAGMLAVLDQVRQVRDRVNAISDKQVKLRAIWKLDALTQRLPAAALTEQDVARFKQELAAFDTWCDPDETNRSKAYWDDLLPALRSRYSEVQVSKVPPVGQPMAEVLTTFLRNALDKPPADLKARMKAEEMSARLGLLWESCSHPDWVEQIAKLHPGTDETKWGPIEAVYKAIDDGWWALLNDDKTKKSVETHAASNLDPAEAYQTIVFRLNAEGEPGLSRSYLMNNKLTYRWTVDVLPPKPWGQETSLPEPLGRLEIVSTQPQIAQYSPQAGRLRASVRVSYEGQMGPEVSRAEPVPVKRSGDFGILGVVETADFMGWAAVLLGSIISGITIYALTPTFGSLKEYLALFTWGASLDQGKNFVQALAAYTSTTPAAPSGGGAAAPPAQKPPATPPAKPPSGE